MLLGRDDAAGRPIFLKGVPIASLLHGARSRYRSSSALHPYRGDAD